MRGVLVAVAVAFALAAAPAPAVAASHGAAISSPTVIALQQTPAPDKTINIDINTNRGGRWYANPMWIAIGAIAVVIVLLLVVLAARGGGGTTIVKE